MFERFTERSRDVVVLAQEEARANKCGYIGTEHLLIGLLRAEGVAADVLFNLIMTAGRPVRADSGNQPPLDTPEKVTTHLREIVKGMSGGSEKEMPGQIPFTPRSKTGLEASLREALSLGHNYIGTEHILLGLLRGSGGGALKILDSMGITTERVHNEVIRVLSGPEAPITQGIEQEVSKRERKQAVLEKTRTKLEEFQKTEEMLIILETAVTLARQYPEASSRAIGKAALELAR